jgi:hypothetical protein
MWFFIGFAVGMIATSILFGAVISYKVNKGHWIPPDAKVSRPGNVPKHLAAFVGALLLTGLLALPSAVFAQTPIPIEIPTDVIFTEANNWIITFAPIAAIGIGISIAIAILGYIGKMIIGAFR